MRKFSIQSMVLLTATAMYIIPQQAQARWAEQEDELPAWAQRGRIMFLRWDDKPLLPEFKDWRPIIHLHGARNPGSLVAERAKLHIPTSLRIEAEMFFGDDRGVKKSVALLGGQGSREHTWYWQYNWWVRDPAFHDAALLKRDGQPMIEYWHNRYSERETGNPLNPLLRRMRREISQAVLTPHDPSSPENSLYPAFPYTPFDTYTGKEPYEYYPVFGHLSMLWYDNPTFWADSSPYSQKIWRAHFKEKFGVDIADPASHPNELVRREWVRFWAEAYGSYLDDVYRYHQENVKRSVVPETTTALNGQPHLTVGLNASLTGTPWGAQMLYLFQHHKIADYPGMLVEYTTQFTRGKRAPQIKFSMASMQGRPTGGAHEGQTLEAEALALNGANALVNISARTKAYLQFQYDNRALLTNALQGNTIGILYNTRSGLVTDTLINAYELGQQMDELGLPYDALVEEDLKPANAAWLRGYSAIVIPGGEFNQAEIAGLKRYVQSGGRLILIGDVEIEGPQYVKLTSLTEPAPFRPDVPLASAFGADSFENRTLRFGRGTVVICEDQILTNAKLAVTLQPQEKKVWRIADSKGGLIFGNVLRQPRQGDARIVGLVNYSGQPQTNIKITLPASLKADKAAAISPDGIGVELPLQHQKGEAFVTVPELYNYTMVLLGNSQVIQAALATVAGKTEFLRELREPLHPAEASPKTMIATKALSPEDVPADQQLARLRHGSNDSGAFIALDAVAPRAVAVGSPIQVRMKVLNTGSHYPETAALEYWRVHLVDVATGREVQTHPDGAPAAIDGAPVFALQDGRTVSMLYKATELNGALLVSNITASAPGRYQVVIDYYYHNLFLQGDAGPHIEPAFPGDRPAACLVFPHSSLGKIYLRYKLPRIIIQVGDRSATN
jgi:hypothetical protein